jgi:hypothetical protein
MGAAARTVRRRLAPPAVLAVLFCLTAGLAAGLAAQATVTTVFTCPSSGSGGNHDNVFNGFYVQGLTASNIHTVLIYYTTDTDGTYELSLTATVGTAGGPQIGSTLTQSSVALASGTDTAVTWDFADPAFTPGQTIYFTHNVLSGPGGVQFNLQPTVCSGDEETVGTSNTPNGLSVATTITETSPPAATAA